MSPDTLYKIEIINVSAATRGLDAASQRRARSHAARESHARTRRLRSMQYQASKAQPLDAADSRAECQTGANRCHVVEECSEPFERLPIGILDVIVPSPMTSLSSARRDPFNTSAGLFNPVEPFLLDHYVKAVLPYLNSHCAITSDLGRDGIQMVNEWIPLVVTDRGLLSGVFLSACRHLALYRYHEEDLSRLTIQYKVACLQALGRAVSSASVTDAMVATAMMLAWDEIAIRDFATCKTHLQAAVKMVEIYGGSKKLGSNGLLEHLLRRFVYDKRLLEDNPPPPCGVDFMTIRSIEN